MPDHELLDTALAWARKLAEPAPLALAKVKSVRADAESRRRDRGREGRVRARLQVEDGKEGISAFLGKRKPKWQVSRLALAFVRWG